MKIKNNELLKIDGGSASITSSMINAITSIIKVLFEAGEGVGSSIRRINDGDICK